mmetsp:Transcript_8630/g.27521  ORF Transcript_8630/g.27521 Transcript_8630/m.27521 type:complete len:248 (-) Transcript_8630:79-822(-)
MIPSMRRRCRSTARRGNPFSPASGQTRRKSTTRQASVSSFCPSFHPPLAHNVVPLYFARALVCLLMRGSRGSSSLRPPHLSYPPPSHHHPPCVKVHLAHPENHHCQNHRPAFPLQVPVQVDDSHGYPCTTTARQTHHQRDALPHVRHYRHHDHRRTAPWLVTDPRQNVLLIQLLPVLVHIRQSTRGTRQCRRVTPGFSTQTMPGKCGRSPGQSLSHDSRSGQRCRCCGKMDMGILWQFLVSSSLRLL